MKEVMMPNLDKMFKEGDTLVSFTINGDDIPGIYTVEYIKNEWITVYDVKHNVYRSYTFKGLLESDELRMRERVKRWKLNI